MTDVGSLAQHAADRLATQHVGVMVAAVAGDIVEFRGAGRLGSVHDSAPDADTLFEIGSVTKVFTALTLARLAVAGKVDIEDPLAQLLPAQAGVPSRGGHEIALRHLAMHTSGLPRLPTGMLRSVLLHPSAPDPYATWTAEQLLRALARTRLGATPGRRFRYSNFGAGLLGLALAHRFAADYETLIAREICEPLGLTDTCIAVERRRSERFAQGHTARRTPTSTWDMADLGGAGGLRSTPRDLATFVRAQLDVGATDLADAIRLSRQVEHQVNGFSWIHLGWMGQRLPPQQGGRRQIWHSGGTGGFCSFIGFDPERGAGVVVLSNTHRAVARPGFDLLRALAER